MKSPFSCFRNENPGFKRIVEKLERSPVCQRLPFRSFLVLPFQRITRIKLLVQVCPRVCLCLRACVRVCFCLIHSGFLFFSPEHCEENYSWHPRGNLRHQSFETRGKGTGRSSIPSFSFQNTNWEDGYLKS